MDFDGLPPFANEKNVELNNELKRRDILLIDLKSKLAESENRIKTIDEHLINVNYETKHTENLINIKTKEKISICNNQKLIENSIKSVKSETNRVISDIKANDERIAQREKELFTSKKEVEELQVDLRINEDEVVNWSTALQQKINEELLIKKYNEEDVKNIENFRRKAEKLNLELRDVKLNIVESVNKTKSRQLELNKLADIFKRHNADRKTLISSWSHNLDNIKKRDKIIHNLIETHTSELVKQEEAKNELGILSKNLEQFITDNCALQKQSDEYYHKLNVTNKADVEEECVELNNHILSIENSIRGVTRDIERNKNLLDNSAKRKQKLLDIIEKNSNFEEQEKAIQLVMSEISDERIRSQKLGKSVDEYNAKLKALTNEYREIQRYLENDRKQLSELKLNEQNYQSKISRAQYSLKNLTDRVVKVENESHRHDILLYTINFNSQLMLRRVNRISGERTVEETQHLENQIAKLKEEASNQKKTIDFIKSNIGSLKSESKIQNTALNRLKKEDMKCTTKLNDIDMDIKFTTKHNGKVRRELEEVITLRDQNLLELSKLSKKIKNKTASLQSAKLDAFNSLQDAELRLVNQENKIKESKTKLKTLEEEKHVLINDLNNRRNSLYTQQQRLELISQKRKSDGEVKSQAYYLLKAAQDREELRRRGDELDTVINKAEDDLYSLESMLDGMNQQNSKFSVLAKAMPTISEQKAELEEQSKEVNSEYFISQRKLDQLNQGIDMKISELNELTAFRENLDADLEHTHTIIDETQLDIDKLSTQIGRQPPSLPSTVSAFYAVQCVLELLSTNPRLHSEFTDTLTGTPLESRSVVS